MKYDILEHMSPAQPHESSSAFDARVMAAVVRMSACAAREPHSHFPFAAVVVRQTDRAIVGQGLNSSQLLTDPTLHGEVVAIKDACSRLGKRRH